jgi:hypothetical protein
MPDTTLNTFACIAIVAAGIYLLGGFLFLLSREIRRDFAVKFAKVREENVPSVKSRWWLELRLALAIAMLGLFAIAFWPYLKWDYRRRGTSHSPRTSKTPVASPSNAAGERVFPPWPELLLKDVNWTYDLTCAECHSEEMVSEYNLSQTGEKRHLCQCEKCAKYAYKPLDSEASTMACECGGQLTRGGVLHCSKCRSFRVIPSKCDLFIV